ncbi:LysM peptidoglycan-binding domain-containing protein [Azovibrio restrictus]|uniref:LysM peptidoglycan-binding domain-containing protein n=1 Tax=Azovibrio restrictus TaxID=146938 RepID=UPI0026F30804|nr:LysM peptidoglycan-binding domain-containing protein [Azovibrio restrictus]MDD3484492.1 LysM peptidoglycan-binding domain-containing protein [Azovibrio restrictus]
MKTPRSRLPSLRPACLPALLFSLATLFSSPAAFADEPFQPLEREEIQQQPQTLQPLDLTAPTQDLWVRLRNGFTMPNLNDDLVLRHQQYYQSRPEYLRRMVERSRPYLHHIIDELEKRGMPTELALLPMVESAYNPMAYSPAHASGLWQFIPSTGRNFRLEQNWWQDQRRDIVASTSAALDYLQYIYEMHGDWHLALASYNWGEGAVGRAIAKNEARGLPTDYANLTMPNETRHYVPKLQALKNIFSNPRLVAELQLPQVPNQPYFRTVVTEAPIDITLAAQFAGLDVDEFVALNPAHNRPVIQAESTLVIPTDRVESFKAGLAAHDEPLSNWKTYALQPGEKLEQVAPRFGITLADLKRVNGLHGRIKTTPGQTLLVPSQTAEGELDTQAFQAPEPPPALVQVRTQPRYHTVRRGDTLQAIARKYDVDLADLKRYNKLKGNAIRTGIRLTVSPGTTTVARQEQTAPSRQQAERPETRKEKVASSKSKRGPKITRHKVRKGDTLFSIARRYNVELDDLRRWNRVAGSNLKVGSTLTIQLDS